MQVTTHDTTRRSRAASPDLTARQAQCLWHIRAYIEQNGFPPSIQEVGVMMKCTSRNAAQTLFAQLRKKGFIEVIDRKSRGLRISATGARYLEENRELVAMMVERGLMQLPVTAEQVEQRRLLRLEKCAASARQRRAAKQPEIDAAKAAKRAAYLANPRVQAARARRAALSGGS